MMRGPGAFAKAQHLYCAARTVLKRLNIKLLIAAWQENSLVPARLATGKSTPSALLRFYFS
jgi:hypothetical protein